MTNKALLDLIDRFNAGDFSRYPYREITRNVTRTTIEITASDHVLKRDLFVVYSDGQCVGLVFIHDPLNEDIHAITHPRFRRRGLMLQAFQEAVLPDLAREHDYFHVTASSVEGASLLGRLGLGEPKVGIETRIDLTEYRR